MLATFKAENHLDENGNPAGGTVDGVGLKIEWQNGPLGQGDERKEPNGAFVETVIAAAKQRLEHYQTLKFSCYENSAAIAALEKALSYLNNRTNRRASEGVEGTHAESPAAV